MLQLTTSQTINTSNPFFFKATGIKVYSFEEVLYHVYHYWRESLDDFLSDQMISWVSEIGHSYLASEMKKLIALEPFTKRIIDFLRLANYFSKPELDGLRTNLEAWEQRREWEKLKERADHLAKRKEYSKAITLYKRALKYEDNAVILNNLGIMHMNLSQTEEAFIALSRALTLEPDNLSILLHYTESAILAGQYPLAEKALNMATAKATENPDIPFLHGLLAFSKKEFPKALEFFATATQKDPTEPHYVYKSVDAHLAMRQFEKALELLNNSTHHDAAHFIKEADIHESAQDIPAAILAMQKAIDINGDAPSAVLFARLAGYHRINKDNQNAEEAIKKALELAPDNDIILLENARIKKGLGRSKEYQTALADLLKGFKEKYRA